MDWYIWILLTLEIPLVWLIWTCIHELSHYIMAKRFAELDDVKWWLYPHRDEEGNLFFAKIQWQWLGPPPSSFEHAMIYLAPRIMNIVASIALPFAALLSLPWMIAWIIFWGAGIVDFFVGSLGMSILSDLRKASLHLKIDAYILRVFGFTTIGISLFLCALFICLRYI